MRNATAAAKTPVIEVCHGPQCSDLGGRALSAELEACGLAVIAGDCRNQCPHAPAALVDNSMISRATAQKIQDKIASLQE
ncbi:MAG: hypothetical protein COW18_00995 [Zetaproteobacteria bacterium CG12_big_fil_rev_8_21_14_0_65_54_13]|nr:MAG: hypothetical protein COW18_00995 [Zetaproteobacteria bacterium CG12_big_fil_rev_8_21_14_0_65_54_13]PIX53344.1 MAG: hypothetical protein COZ50_13805 [Zetaproteobacteria bacterium CG_4_10_14_3_um_filter_54_28]PJA30608.1 MAG: hypothetical protein CO188_02790 [Zetaproteobacteria bacterium CG_4_9_14_3_um_filter_54_145]